MAPVETSLCVRAGPISAGWRRAQVRARARLCRCFVHGSWAQLVRLNTSRVHHADIPAPATPRDWRLHQSRTCKRLDEAHARRCSLTTGRRSGAPSTRRRTASIADDHTASTIAERCEDVSAHVWAARGTTRSRESHNHLNLANTTRPLTRKRAVLLYCFGDLVDGLINSRHDNIYARLSVLQPGGVLLSQLVNSGALHSQYVLRQHSFRHQTTK